MNVSLVAATSQGVHFARSLARYSVPIRTAPFTYICLTAQVMARGGGGGGGGTRVPAGRWHAGRTLILLLQFNSTILCT